MIIAEKISKTVRIEASTVDIEERGVKLRLTVVDTPGFGDAIDAGEWSVRIYNLYRFFRGLVCIMPVC